MVYYCGHHCRDKHTLQHKDDCVGLLQKLSERTGEILRDIFCVLSERAYTWKISSIAKDSDTLMVSDGASDLRTSSCALSQIPAALLPDLRDRHAVLCVGRSEHVLAYMHELLAQMPKDTGPITLYYPSGTNSRNK
jgi:hypothetical protein